METVWDSRASTQQDKDNSSSNSIAYQKRGCRVSLDNCDDIFCFLEDFGVLVCKQHCTGVINLNTHLLQHHDADATTRRQIINRFTHIATVDPNQIELPEEPALPIEELGAPLNALRCKACTKITINSDAMRKHCKNNHQQAWTGDKSALCDTVKVQSFFRTGGLQKYFIVEYNAVVNAEEMAVEGIVERRLAEFKSTQEIIEKELQVLDEAAKTDKTGWYKRTGWIEFFKDRNLSHLAYQLRMPDRHEPKLKLVAELTELLIERCVKGLSTLPHEIRRWLRSAKREAPDTRPLGRLQNPSRYDATDLRRSLTKAV